MSEDNESIYSNELKLLALSKLSNSENIMYNTLRLLSKKPFQSRPNCGKMKRVISETINQAYS